MTYIPRPLDNSVTSTQTIRDGAELINNNFEELAETISALEDLESDVSDIEGVLSDNTNAASRKVATNAQALAGTAGVLPDAAGVHAAFKQFGLGTLSPPVISDANTALMTGFYQGFGTGATNFAGTQGQFGTLIVTRRAAVVQQINQFLGGGFGIRASLDSGATWQPWVIIHHTGNGANNAEALAGTNNEKWMSPQRVHEAYSQWGLGRLQAGKKTIGDFSNAFEDGSYTFSGGSVLNGPPSLSGFTGECTVRNSSIGTSFHVTRGSNAPVIIIGSRSTPTGAPVWRELHHTGNGATNADALAGTNDEKWMSPQRVHEAFKQFGLGATTTPIVTNLGNQRASGQYRYRSLSGSVGGPAGEDNGIVTVRAYTELITTQIFESFAAGGRIYQRFNNSAVWSPWRELHHTDNGATNAEALAGSNNTKWMSPQRVHEAFKQFGLGRIPFGPTGVDIDNPSLPCGFYVMSTTGQGTHPPQLVGGYQVIVNPYRLTSEPYFTNQIAISNRDNGGRMFIRAGSGTQTDFIWQPWRELHHVANGANSAEALAGTNNEKWMSSLRVREALIYSAPRLMRNVSGGSISVEANVAGSGLRYSKYNSSGAVFASATAASGTWRNATDLTVADNEYGFFMRVV